MDKPPAAVFDELERDSIRRALRRYMAEHRIGAPRLQILMQDRGGAIALPTLQRFVNDTHRTSDPCVAVCHAFVKDLPYYGQDADITRLGGALCEFFQEPMDVQRREETIAALGRELSGSYRVQFRPATLFEGSRRDLSGSCLELTPVPGRPWMRAREFEPYGRSSPDPQVRGHTYDGVVIFLAPLIHVFLRNNLTRQPRIYTVEKSSSSARKRIRLTGQRVHAAVPRHQPQPPLRFFSVMLEQQAVEGDGQ